ncbi:MAG: copper oxidase [Chitinophagaceae bacterium]|nr:MAG: copper oxidase [Chitinophagaceae bacterium]
MHPEVQRDRPGNCPKCGMPLLKRTVRVAAPKAPARKPRPAAEPKAPKKEPVPPGGQQEAPGMAMPHVAAPPAAPDTAAAVYRPESVNLAPGKTVVYHLYVTDTVVNYTGKRRHAYAVNGQLPAPTLVFTEGDTAEIWLHNNLQKEATSLHWHGVILPNRFDGVPYLTTKRIGPGETHLYKFRVVQNGTYWYHSHTALQEQQGMYGMLLFQKRGETAVAASPVSMGSKHVNLVLSEWADEDPMQTQRRLRSGNDWYSIKKRSTQSYSEAIRAGQFRTKLTNEWKRMKAMDVSDDYYERFLANGQPEASAGPFKAGDTVTVHVVNGGASTYFWLMWAGGKIEVVGNDGNDVAPVPVDRLLIAPAETYDLRVPLPTAGSYELRATAEDRTGASSMWLGTGTQHPAPRLGRLQYFAGMKMMNDMMNTDGSMNDMGMKMSLQQMDMNSVMYPELTDTAHPAYNPELLTLNYGMLRAPQATALAGGPTKTLHFQLTGNMNRYLWTLDNKTVNEADRILIQKGEKVRLILTNNSMMRHPMHLHGHDFRVLNGQGDYAPLKNVIDILPMETDSIEFAANQEGSWFFHCHILFHMMAGMGRVFENSERAPNPDLPDSALAARMFRHDNNMLHLMARVGIESNGSDGEAMLSSNRYALQGTWHIGTQPHHGYETELAFGRYLGANQWWFPYIGYDYHHKRYESPKEALAGERNLFGQQSNKANRSTFTVGVQYLAPFLLLADARVDGKGKFRFQLSREDIPVTPRLRFNLMGNTDKEYMVGFRYVLRKWLALSTHYDSDMGPGAGVTLTY